MTHTNKTRADIDTEFETKRARAIALWKPVAVVGVDEAAGRKAPDFPAACVFTLKLNRAPDHEWTQLFDQCYRYNIHNMKRSAKIVGDRVELIVADSDNLQTQVDFVKQVVASTNTDAEVYLNQKLLPKIDREHKDALAQLESLENLRAKSKGLNI